ncbi:hypothetical protein [Spirosoma areae]
MPSCTLQIKPLLLALLIFIAGQAQSQSIVEQPSLAVRRGLSGGFDLGVAFKRNYLNPSLVYYELTSLTRSKTVFVGWTARVSAFYGSEVDYYTAPARLTRVETIDTVSFGRLSQTSLNLGIRAEWNLGRFQLGASVDLLGLTFLGRSRVGRVYSSTGLFNQTDSLDQTIQKPFQGQDAFQPASPTRFNVRLLGDHDRGMLTTELYARVYLRANVALKVGYQWLTTEMALSNRDQVANNERFRNRAGSAYVALTFPLNPW